MYRRTECLIFWPSNFGCHEDCLFPILVVGRCRDDLSSIISNPKIDVDNLKKKKMFLWFFHFPFMGFGCSTRFFKIHIMQSNVVQMAQVMGLSYDKVNPIIINPSMCMWWVIHASQLLFHSFNMEYLKLAWIMFLVLLKVNIVSSQFFSWIMKCNHT